MKKCRDCKNLIPIEQFYRHSDHYYRSYCKPCSIKRTANWTRSHPETARKVKFKYLYRITLEDFDNILSKQGYLCPICEKDIDRNNGQVDHDHATGEIRGILHPECNKALGLFRDNATWLANAINYLNVTIQAGAKN